MVVWVWWLVDVDFGLVWWFGLRCWVCVVGACYVDLALGCICLSRGCLLTVLY